MPKHYFVFIYSDQLRQQFSGYEAYDLVISLNQTFQNSCSTCVYTKALTIIHRIAALCKIQRDEAQLSGNETRSLVTRGSI